MEEEKQIEPISLEQDQGQEEVIPNNQDEIVEEDKIIPMIEANQFQGEVKEERNEIEAEVTVENPLTDEGKVGEGKIDSQKKLKQGSKQNLVKAKVTVPQPFSLATEKRMSRERRGSMDFKDFKPPLSRSGSLNYKGLSQSLIGAEKTSELRRAKSIRTTAAAATKSGLPPKVAKASDQPTDKRVVENGPKAKNKTQGKETEKKKPQLYHAKEGGGELESSTKMQKSASFKALPLPSFYQHKVPLPKPETKKIPAASQIKSPVVGQESKSVPKSGDSKGKTMSKSTISSSAKETIISKLLIKTTRKKSPSTPNEMVKASA